MSILKGIDVSKYQSVIDWEKVKPQIDFAILRCGYGNDLVKQDDEQFIRNADECERLNIPYGVYLYSYATTEGMVDSEIAHALRVIGNRKPFCVYFDMEDKSTEYLGKVKLTSFAKRFCESIKTKGFKVGIYGNQYWFQTFLDVAELKKTGYSIWCAKFSENKPNIAAEYDIWQYSSKGSVDGISGNVDMNYMYNDIRNIATNVPTQKSVSELAQEVIAGSWGNGEERKQRLTAAGYNYSTVQAEVNKLLSSKKKSNEEIAKEVIKGLWGNGAERKERLAQAGYNHSEIQKIVNKLMK